MRRKARRGWGKRGVYVRKVPGKVASTVGRRRMCARRAARSGGRVECVRARVRSADRTDASRRAQRPDERGRGQRHVPGQRAGRQRLLGAELHHYDQYDTDFMFANGTGGLAIWSLKDPAHPALVSTLTAAQLRVPGDTQDRFWEGENMTVDPKRKLVFLTRDPRGFGGTVTTGQSGVYIIDVKDPWNPKTSSSTRSRPATRARASTTASTSGRSGPTARARRAMTRRGRRSHPTPSPMAACRCGSPTSRTSSIRSTIRRPSTPTGSTASTGYVHSVDVDRDGVAWAAGAGGDRGYWTEGNHWDPVLKRNRIATASDPVPYAGGVTPPVNPTRTDFFDVLRPQRPAHHREARQLRQGRAALRHQRGHHDLLASGRVEDRVAGGQLRRRGLGLDAGEPVPAEA